jgi:serine/threonine protein phosphatase 1
VNKKGNDWVIPDIHGCIKTLRSLINSLSLSSDDRLFFLGDYVNKGPSSDQVLDYLMELKKNMIIYTLRGNHEQMILDFSGMSTYEFEYHLNGLNSTNLTGEDFKLRKEYKKFLQTLPYYIELPEFLLVHGGFDFSIENPFTAYERMIWIRNMKTVPQRMKNKRVIHGHIPHDFETIIQQLKDKAPIIPLDNGCVYSNRQGLGTLIALELNTLHLEMQRNIDC